MAFRKKILFFLPGSVGGAERMTVTIGKFLPREEFEVKFVIVMETLGNIVNFIPDGYPISQIKIKNIWNFGTTRIYNLMKKEKPYAVFCSMMYLNARITIAAKMIGGIKVIIRNSNYMSTIRLDQYLICRLSYPFADIIISQQEEMKDDIVKKLHVDERKVIVLHNPIDIDTIRKCTINVTNPYPKYEQVNYLWVGRVTENKGQDIAVLAFLELHRTEPKSHLYFVGRYNENSEFYKYITNLIEENDLRNYVHFIGFDSNPYRWIKYCDCFVLPSRIEGLPNALIEAQYLGRPAAATRCIPIIERIISEGVTGYTAPVQNAKALAEAMFRATKLGDIKMTYKSAEKKDFVKLFG